MKPVVCVYMFTKTFNDLVFSLSHCLRSQLHSLEIFSNPVSNQCICDDLNKWRDKCELGKEFPIYLVLANMLLR